MKGSFSDFDFGTFFAVTVLMLFGGVILFISFIGFDYTLQGFGKIFFKNGAGITIGVMFEAVVVYYYFTIIKEKLAKNKTITAKLVTIEDRSKYLDTGNKYILNFQDENRKEYIGESRSLNDYKESQNYYIVVKNNEVIDIKGKSDEILVVKEESNWHYYWLNTYLPFAGKLEDTLLLPIYYVLAFLFVFAAFQNFMCFIVFCYMLFFIGYDVYYKFFKK